MNLIPAKANPEERLFISLITRDIPLVAAFLDLIDNSINSSVEPVSQELQTAADYERMLADEKISPEVEISLEISPERIEITDSASGIFWETARDHVFTFGRSTDKPHPSDRLSVYGIGLKRAIFKLGNKVTINSDHVNGGFGLTLDVTKWAEERMMPWSFPISRRDPVDPGCTGTRIIVESLHDETKRRVADGVFLGQLKEAVSRTYAFYLTKFVNISIMGDPITGLNISIGSNHTSEQFVSDDVSCSVMAGIATPEGDEFKAKTAGWYVFCNGRTVVFADKTVLTGWGLGPTGLPIFQPKHRAFMGTVFFVSQDAEKLPWTTTKSGINEDSAIWQEAKRQMASVGRSVLSFLDSRYSEDGVEIAAKELSDAAGPRVSVIAAAVSPRRTFEAPKKPRPEKVRIQYDAKIEDVKRVADYVGRPRMGGAEVGRYTFRHFLKNEVGEK